MTADDEVEIVSLMRAARAKARGYADFFGWPIDRDIEEWGVVTALIKSLDQKGEVTFSNLRRRGRPNDPPDCEAFDSQGKRTAIEVTEIVDGKAIEAFKAGRHYDWAEWPRDKFLSVLSARLAAKDLRFPELKDAPYDGGYVVVVHTDEPNLKRASVEEYLAGYKPECLKFISRAFLVLSYDPELGSHPSFELALHGQHSGQQDAR